MAHSTYVALVALDAGAALLRQWLTAISDAPRTAPMYMAWDSVGDLHTPRKCCWGPSKLEHSPEGLSG
eukprot:8258462-Pyramimonas_sp.AAC.1